MHLFDLSSSRRASFCLSDTTKVFCHLWLRISSEVVNNFYYGQMLSFFSMEKISVLKIRFVKLNGFRPSIPKIVLLEKM